MQLLSRWITRHFISPFLTMLANFVWNYKRILGGVVTQGHLRVWLIRLSPTDASGPKSIVPPSRVLSVRSEGAVRCLTCLVLRFSVVLRAIGCDCRCEFSGDRPSLASAVGGV